METAVREVVEAEVIDARLLALHAEKARIDAEIATTTEELRRHLEHRMFEYTAAGQPAAGSSARSVKRRRTNYADTATASSIACLLRISERAAHRLVQHANILLNYQPATHQALSDGLISWQHATTIIDQCTGLPESTAGLLETQLLTLAADTTPARLAARARTLRTRLHAESLHQRAASSTTRRRVDIDPDHDGMAWLHAHLPATEATAIDARLTHTARTLQTPTETRTLAQLRTDVLVDLLLTDTNTHTGQGVQVGPGGADRTALHAGAPVRRGSAGSAGTNPDRAGVGVDSSGTGVSATLRGCVGECAGRGGVRANVNVTVPVLTLLGVDDAPADLEGYGPIPADVARRLAAHAPSFTRILTHPETGAVLSVGRTTYTVPADLKKWLRVRDRTCRHPGCTIPASRCELDHTTPWSHNGPTTHDNLAHLCRKHHALKSDGIWHYHQHPTGTLTATSPTGRTYDTTPDPPPF